MASNWQVMTLAKAGVSLVDCDHRTPPGIADGYPYIAIPQLKDGHVVLDGVRRISREHLDEWTKKLKPREHDVIVVRRCNSGVSAVVPRGVEWAIGQNLVVLRADGRNVSPPFLRWLVRGEGWWEQVRKYINVGAVFDSLRCRDIPNFEVTVPPLKEQDRICELLDAVDHLINLLRQTNASLESIAQALFKSWFIDFDPVRAKDEGREPEGMDASTAALFPAKFEESSLGLIPKGWGVSTFGNLAVLGKGSVNPMDFPTSTFEHYSLPAFDAGQLPFLEAGETIKSNKTRVPPRAVLQSKLNPHIPRVWLIGDNDRQAVCSTEFLPWVAREGASRALIYCTLRSPSFEAQVRTLVTGTSNSHQRVKPDQVASLKVVAAPPVVAEAFASLVEPMHGKVMANRLRAQNLAELRDALLPRLISGKLRLPEAQAQLEDTLA